MKTTVTKKFKDYLTYCGSCENEISIKYRDCYFYKAKPYCYPCRNKLIRETNQDIILAEIEHGYL